MKVLKCIIVSIASVLLACVVFVLTASFFTVTNLLFLNSIYVVLAVASILFCLIVCAFEKTIKERLKITSRLYIFSAFAAPAIFAVISYIIVQHLIHSGYHFSGGLMPGLNESLWAASIAVIFCGALVGRGLLTMVSLLKGGFKSREKQACFSEDIFLQTQKAVGICQPLFTV